MKQPYLTFADCYGLQLIGSGNFTQAEEKEMFLYLSANAKKMAKKIMAINKKKRNKR